MMAKKRNPCWGCEFRAVACHSKCGAYQVWKSEDSRRKAKIQQTKEQTFIASPVFNSGYIKTVGQQ